RGGAAVYGGIQIIRKSRVTAVKADIFSLRDVWFRLIAEDRIAAVTYPGGWCDVGTPDGLDRANAMVANRV
ncbi:MAG: nucleotidyltransferase family protein, partial [Pseudomonadota bacterium]